MAQQHSDFAILAMEHVRQITSSKERVANRRAEQEQDQHFMDIASPPIARSKGLLAKTICKDARIAMDRNTLERHLALADEHVAQGNRHISAQVALIEILERDGHKTEMARVLLEQFQE